MYMCIHITTHIYIHLQNELQISMWVPMKTIQLKEINSKWSSAPKISVLLRL